MTPKKSEDAATKTGSSPSNDILLHETLKILGDYVSLLAAQK
jgi:hypothetical protein